MVEMTDTTGEAGDKLTVRAADDGMDMAEVLQSRRKADASAGNVLGGVYGHEEFCRAVHGFLGSGKADDLAGVVMETADYDYSKNVGGGGGAAPKKAVKERNINMKNEEVAVAKVNLRNPEMVGRFMALVDEMNWAIEWGFSKAPRAHDMTVIVAPSRNLDY